jgi:sialic acid synthase SpsE
VLGLEGAEVAVAVVQATSPLTPPRHLADAILRHEATRRPVVSVARSSHPLEWGMRVDEGKLVPALEGFRRSRRQELPPHYLLTGAVYVASASHISGGGDFFVPGESEAVELEARFVADVDEPDDLLFADARARLLPVRELVLGERRVGPGNPCFVIAEIGVNHDGEVAKAHALIDAAAATGADAVKFQTFVTESLVSKRTRMAAYQRDGGAHDSDMHAMLARLELPREALPELRDHARERGLLFFSTPFDRASAELLASLGVPCLKLGSGELTNVSFLRDVAKLGLPVLLSTGMGTLMEVGRALSVLSEFGCDDVALFQCVSAYPAPAEVMNVRAIATLRDAFHVPVGLSDHCASVGPMLASVGLGAALWEKHLTLDTRAAGPDHAASLDPTSFAAQVAAVREAERALGTGQKVPHACERDAIELGRRRIFAARTLPEGTRVTEDMLLAVRGERGLGAERWFELLGRRLASTIEEGEPILAEALLPETA